MTKKAEYNEYKIINIIPNITKEERERLQQKALKVLYEICMEINTKEEKKY